MFKIRQKITPKDGTTFHFLFCYSTRQEEEMRIALLIKDLEYRDALVQNLAESGSEILLDIVSAGEKLTGSALRMSSSQIKRSMASRSE